ncbi:hypothetical protein HZP42_19090 [Elizabethkingia anophelis]|nr:hypothetical protein [Elizabethkingia anophelis]
MEGKAKEALLNFLKQNHWTDYVLYVESQKPISNELIIYWLDSVGIYIDIEFFRKNIKDEALFVTGTTDELNGFQPLGVEYHSRQEATEAAIKKAVEIFNEKYKENE